MVLKQFLSFQGHMADQILKEMKYSGHLYEQAEAQRLNQHLQCKQAANLLLKMDIQKKVDDHQNIQNRG
jgi:hypothetical protein